MVIFFFKVKSPGSVSWWATFLSSWFLNFPWTNCARLTEKYSDYKLSLSLPKSKIYWKLFWKFHECSLIIVNSSLIAPWKVLDSSLRIFWQFLTFLILSWIFLESPAKVLDLRWLYVPVYPEPVISILLQCLELAKLIQFIKSVPPHQKCSWNQ